MARACSSSSARTRANPAWRSSSTRSIVSLFIVAPALPRLFSPDILLLPAFEVDEILDLFLRRGAQPVELVHQRLAAVALVEEVADIQIEGLEDLEQRVESDLVLSLLHPGEVRLVDADALGELHLGQLPLAAELPDLASDELELCWLAHAGFVDFYAIRQ